MRSILRLVFGLLLISPWIGAQHSQFTEQQLRQDWQEYTDFQRSEFISFCDFLYVRGYYERASLSYFQYLYRFPGDTLETIVYYRIARCYDFTGSPELAQHYYQRAQEVSDSTSPVYKLAWYRSLTNLYYTGQYDSLFARTLHTKDPYLLILSGYARLQKREWNAARQSFKAALERYNHGHYQDIIEPLLESIDQAGNIPRKQMVTAVAAASVPGGGYLYFGMWRSAVATAFTFGMAVYSGVVVADGIGRFWPPLVAGIGIYAGSIWQAYSGTNAFNREVVYRYAGQILREHPLERFQDFPEPEIFHE